MIEKVYLDSNIFVYASTSKESVGIKAREFLAKIKEGTVEGITSVLSLDEVMWTLNKLAGKKTAHEIVSSLFSFPNLTLVDATKGILASALQIYLQEEIHPRDAIHLATMRFKNTDKIATNDSDFDRIRNIKRIRFD